jgi:UDP-glucose 4-epimerase
LIKVLVTGGAGFIGSHIVEHFQGSAEVRVLDNLRTGFRRNLAGFEHEFIEASITDREAVRRAMQGVDFVFHLAAMISVPESMQKPIECNEINTAGTLVVLEEAARAKVRKLVFSSSAAIYGNNPQTPKIETMLPEPKSPYAITKIAGEYYCKMFADEGWLATAALRYFNVFGPRQDPKSQYAAAVPIFIERAMKNEPLTIYGDGNQTRDFIYVKDIAAANAFFAAESSATGAFNLGYGRSVTIKDLALTICQSAGSVSPIEHVPDRPGDVKHSMAAIDKLREAGFNPVGNLRDGLEATINFFGKRKVITVTKPQ